MKNYNKQYYQTHKNEMLTSIKTNQKYKYANDNEYNIYKRVMARINQTFPGIQYSFEDLLGCSLSFYCDYIKFCLGNNELQDIDHVIPINNSKDLNCFKWYNTYPIEASLNRSIKDKSSLESPMRSDSDMRASISDGADLKSH